MMKGDVPHCYNKVLDKWISKRQKIMADLEPKYLSTHKVTRIQ